MHGLLIGRVCCLLLLLLFIVVRKKKDRCMDANRDIGVALCPNTEDVLIYSNAMDKDVTKWKLEYTLSGHDLVVSGCVSFYFLNFLSLKLIYYK
jgi:hypothetical protein